MEGQPGPSSEPDLITSVSDAGRRPGPKECGQLLKAGKGEETDTPIAPFERNPALPTPIK